MIRSSVSCSGKMALTSGEMERKSFDPLTRPRGPWTACSAYSTTVGRRYANERSFVIDVGQVLGEFGGADSTAASRFSAPLICPALHDASRALGTPRFCTLLKVEAAVGRHNCPGAMAVRSHGRQSRLFQSLRGRLRSMACGEISRDRFPCGRIATQRGTERHRLFGPLKHTRNKTGTIRNTPDTPARHHGSHRTRGLSAEA
jgi:hypothetical protein